MTSVVVRSGPVFRWGRAGAVYDLVVTVLFATPWTAVLVIDGLRAVHDGLGLGGAAPPSLAPFTTLVVSLFGVVVSMWAVARWSRPEPAQFLALPTAGDLTGDDVSGLVADKVGQIDSRIRDLSRMRTALLELAANGATAERCPVLAALAGS